MVTISLPRDDVGQILDALCVREEAWRYTQRYFEEGTEEPGRLIEECRDGEEARRIADYYAGIIAKLHRELK
jgi:hypothetical protein